MKPFYQQLAPVAEQSFIFDEEERPHFIVPWHYHPEIEILMVVSSTGTSFVGDSVRSFDEGDVCMIGENLPHWWKSDGVYHQRGSKLNMKAHVIQFRSDVFESRFLPLPEMAPVRQLIERSRRGIRFTGEARIKIGRTIRKIFRDKGLKRVAGLLLLLELMAHEQEYEYLASVGFTQNLQISCAQKADFERFNRVHEYIIHHFTDDVRLEDVAAIAHLAPTAFCRYFKSHTGKRFISFLNEYRIGHANRLMLSTKSTIADIAFECGFHNISNFNDQFRKITGYSPKQYREMYTKDGDSAHR